MKKGCAKLSVEVAGWPQPETNMVDIEAAKAHTGRDPSSVFDLFGSQIQGDLRVDAGSGVSLHVRLSWKGRWRPAFSLSRIFVPVPSGRGASQGHPPAV